VQGHGLSPGLGAEDDALAHRRGGALVEGAVGLEVEIGLGGLTRERVLDERAGTHQRSGDALNEGIE